MAQTPKSSKKGSSQSSSKETSQDSQTSSTKRRRKGIFRTEAFLLLLVLFALVGVYYFFFLNMHLKYILEKTMTKAYGAEVNIGSLTLDLAQPSLEILDIDFTNHEKPMENLFSIGKLGIQLNRKDLMFMSITSDEAQLEGLKVNSPRKRRGYVSPESQRLISISTDFKGSKEQAFDKKFEGSIFENLYTFSKTKDYKQELQKISKELNLSQLEQDYKKLFESKKQKAKEIESHFKKEKYENLITAAKKLNQTPQNSEQWVASLSTAQKLIAEAKDTRDELKKLKKDVELELNDAKNIEARLQKDLQDKLNQAKAKFQFPDISPASFSQEFFGNLFQTRFYLVQHWIAQARKNSEQAIENRFGNKAAEIVRQQIEAAQKEPDNQERVATLEEEYKALLKQTIADTGEYIHFGNTVRPKLWIKKLNVDAQSKTHQDLQNFKGHILNIADNQKTIGKPLEVFLRGDIPQHQLEDINIDIKLNHHLKEMNESFNIAAWYPISSFKIFNDSSFKLFLEKASVRGALKGSITEMKLSDFGFFNQFRDAEFFFETSKGEMQKILQPIFAQLPQFNVDVLLSGNFLNPDMLIKSSLGQKVSDGIKTHFSSELELAQNQIQSLADDSLKSIQNKYLKPYLGDINLLDREVLSSEQLLQTELKKLEAKIKDEHLDKLKDKAKDALKKLKF